MTRLWNGPETDAPSEAEAWSALAGLLGDGLLGAPPSGPSLVVARLDALLDGASRAPGEQLLDELAANEAYGRAAEVWEIAATIAMLASDYTTYLTGEVVSISSQRA